MLVCVVAVVVVVVFGVGVIVLLLCVVCMCMCCVCGVFFFCVVVCGVVLGLCWCGWLVCRIVFGVFV